MSAHLYTPLATNPPRGTTLVRRASAPLLPCLFVLTAMLPQGLNIRPGGLLFTTPRIVIILSMPIIITRLLRGISRSGFRLGMTDIIVILAAFWMFLAVSMTQGIARAAVGSSTMILELCGGYCLIRTSLRRPGEAVAVARFLAYVMAADGVVSILDVVTRHAFLIDLADSLTGYVQDWQLDYRNGRMRALGMQEHPILLGCVCTFGALLSLLIMKGAKRALVFAGCLIGVITSNSSAPITGFALGCGLLAYHHLTARIARRWQLLMLSSGTLITLFILIHPNPFGSLIQHTAAVPQDGYYRLMIWSIVGPLVLASPIFGIGLESDFAARFHVGNTIDCFWLCSAVQFGIVGSALFALMLIGACERPVKRQGAMTDEDVQLGRALGIIIFLYFFIGATVHFWGTAWMLMGVFAAMRVHLGEMSADREVVSGDLSHATTLRRHASKFAR